MRVQGEGRIAGIVQKIGHALVASMAVGVFACSEDGGGGCPAEPEHECSWDDSFDQAQCPSMSNYEQCVVFVDQNVECSGNGKSWAEAKKTLQEGVDAAACGVLGSGMCATWEVWVRGGTYRINQGCVEDTLRLRSNVELFGGFTGEEIAMTDRDPLLHVTVIEGQAEGSEERVNNVVLVQAAEGVVLDGFTVRGGDAQIDAYTCANAKPFEGGGGVALFDGSLTINGCVFRDNRGRHGAAIGAWYSGLEISDGTFEDNECQLRGGAVHGNDSSLDLRLSSFTGNLAGSGGANGGGAVLWEGGDAEIVDCDFTGNSATLGLDDLAESMAQGGAIFFIETDALVQDCAFTENSADIDGGAIRAGMANVTLSRCDFVENVNLTGHTGAGVSPAFGTMVIEECTFIGNRTEAITEDFYGRSAGLELWGVETATVSDTFFEGNIASGDGGGVGVVDCGDVTFERCMFLDNSADRGAGLLIEYDPDESTGGNVVLDHCTFASNDAATEAADLLVVDELDVGTVAVSNSILWSTAAPISFTPAEAEPAVTYSDVRGGFTGEGNIDADPLFVNEAVGDLHLTAGSPCIDACADGTSDMGAYEYEGN